MQTTDVDEAVAATARAGRRRRAFILVGVGLCVVLLSLMAFATGRERADREVDRIRAAAGTERVDTSAMASFMFKSGPNPIARALGVPDQDVALRGPNPAADWCARVAVRRVMAERFVYLSITDDGVMQRVERCGQ